MTAAGQLPPLRVAVVTDEERDLLTIGVGLPVGLFSSDEPGLLHVLVHRVAQTAGDLDRQLKR